MRIDKKSWHYRTMNWVHFRLGNTFNIQPQSLCTYFWSLVFHLLFMPVAAALLSPFILFIFLIVWLYKGVAWIWSHLPKSERESTYEGSFRQVIVETGKAWKGKVCPLITYE